MRGSSNVGVLQVPAGTDPDEVMRRIQQAMFPDVPEQSTGPDDDGEGRDGRPMFLVQLVLDRPYKNHIEAHALDHALSEADGVTGTGPPFLIVVVGNPLAGGHGADGEYTFTSFTIRAHTESEVERVVREAVTDTVPAPFGIASIVVSAVAPKARGEG